MRKLCNSATLLLMLLMVLSACGQSVPKTSEDANWQEQYDLGMRYLSEEKCEEAIIAFTAAIEIDPKQASAYIGRGQAYVLMGEDEENMAAAKSDFETAIELNETMADAWLGLADVYIRLGDYDKAQQILQDALKKTGNAESIVNKLAEIENGMFSDSEGKTRRSNHIENGELIEYWIYDYDENGNNTTINRYKADGTWENIISKEYNENGQEVRRESKSEGYWSEEVVYEYDGERLAKAIRTTTHESGDSITYSLYSYDDSLRTQTIDDYDEENELESRFIIEHDETGKRIKGTQYHIDSNGIMVESYYVVYIWNDDGSYGGYEQFNVTGDNTD